MQTVGRPPRGFAPNGAGKETMEEIKKLTKEEEMDVGRQIYDRLLTIPIAAEKFGVTYSAARRWLRAYRAANGLPPNNRGFSEGGHRRFGLHDEGPADRRGDKGEGGRRASKKRVHGERRWCGKGVLQLRRCEFEIVYALSADFPVWRVCRVMGINRSGFYKWRDSVLRPSEKKKKREADIALFKEFHEKFPSHGYRWLRAKIELDTRAVYSDNYA